MREETEKLVRTISGLMGSTAWDYVTGGELKPAEVRALRKEDMWFFKKMNATRDARGAQLTKKAGS